MVEKVEKVEKEVKKDQEIKLSKDLEGIITKIEKMSVLDLNLLVKALEEKFGVSAQAPVAVTATANAQAGAEAEKVEEKSIYDVILSDFGSNKITVIKAVREINQNLGLKEAKELVEAAPKPIAEEVKKEDAEAYKQKLEAAGATVELK